LLASSSQLIEIHLGPSTKTAEFDDVWLDAFGHATQLYWGFLIYHSMLSAAIELTANILSWSLNSVSQSSLPFRRNFARPNCNRSAVSHHIAVLVDLYIRAIQCVHEGIVRSLLIISTDHTETSSAHLPPAPLPQAQQYD
jgi:hypothetical protein